MLASSLSGQWFFFFVGVEYQAEALLNVFDAVAYPNSVCENNRTARWPLWIYSCSFPSSVLARSPLQAQWSHGPSSIHYLRRLVHSNCDTSIPHPRDKCRKEYVIQVCAMRCEGMSLIELLGKVCSLLRKKHKKPNEPFASLVHCCLERL